ncbi:MAG: hypothetical protein A3J79_05545 [Elusimicrobia bacterium RIFOXYB2_FULL_62_6]|nr:MAG: hypothetical protein A3J79_05545 [Elusimicrobia bacterium RIFOXYB2_FULL_62_6]
MPQKLLIVDDDEGMRRLYEKIFTRRGYSISLAASNIEAKNLLRAGAYGLIITEFILPDGTGAELAGLPDAKGERPPIIVVTDFIAPGGLSSFSGDRQFAKQLNKPFIVENLISAAQLYLGAAGKNSER